jgi:hypothetical protein
VVPGYRRGSPGTATDNSDAAVGADETVADDSLPTMVPRHTDDTDGRAPRDHRTADPRGGDAPSSARTHGDPSGVARPVLLADGGRDPGDAADRSAGGPFDGAILADYDFEMELRTGSDRRIDIEALADRLDALGVTDYFFLVWHRETDWADLQRFLPVAAERGIDVWAYLVPPSETPEGAWSERYSEPYRTDYVAWGEAIATLSTDHGNLVGWAVDDFQRNTTTEKFGDRFTPEYMRRVTDAVDAVAPDLSFLALLYGDDITPAFLDDYAPYVDGVVFAYPEGRAEAEERIGTAAAHGLPTLLMPAVLAKEHRNRYDTPATVRTMAANVELCTALVREGRAAGVVTYGLDKSPDADQGMFAPVRDAYASVDERERRRGVARTGDERPFAAHDGSLAALDAAVGGVRSMWRRVQRYVTRDDQ